MSWLSKLFTGGNPIKDAGEALDGLITSDEERMQAQAVLLKLQADLEVALQTQFTERWKADMASDSWFSKNIRPLMWLASGAVFFGLLLLAVVLAVPEYAVNYAFQAFTAISGLYIVARGVDKGIVNWKGK